jgi:hypothetical protein
MAINITINPAPETNINVTSQNTSVTMANEKGPQGGIGIQGAQGPAATISVGTVTGLPAGSTPVVTNIGTSGAAVFNFQIPEAGTPFGDWTVNGYKIINMADPTNPQDAVTKAYADQIASGLNVHDSVDVATTAALTATYVDGTSDASGGLGVGATLTITATGVLTIDDIPKVLNDRILVKDQTDAKQNGVYRVSTAGAVGVSAVLTRAEDSNNSVPGELGTGDFIYVQRGTVNGTKAFVMNSTGTSTNPVNGIKIGTDNINYTQFTGLTLSTTTPAADGTATAGTGTTAARDDHVHPAITTSAGLASIISDETGTGSLVFNTNPLLTAPVTIQHTGGYDLFKFQNDTNGNLKIGRVDNVASTPYIDFHSGATSIDHDVRIIASGGNGTVGNGDLDISANNLTKGSVAIPTISSTDTLSNKTLTAPTLASNLGTVSAGVVAYDGSAGYLTTSTTHGRGILPSVLFACNTATKSLANATTANQPLFATPTNGALTVPGDTTYFIDALISLTMGTTTTRTVSFSLVGNGTATFTSVLFETSYSNALAGTLVAVQTTTRSVATGGLLNASTALGGGYFRIQGVARTNISGTIIPSITFSSAPGGTNQVNANSFIRLTPVGNGSVTTSGAWA